MSSPIRAACRLALGHRTIERTGLTRQRSRRPCGPQGGALACPAGDPLTDTCWPGQHAWNVVCADDLAHSQPSAQATSEIDSYSAARRSCRSPRPKKRLPRSCLASVARGRRLWSRPSGSLQETPGLKSDEVPSGDHTKSPSIRILNLDGVPLGQTLASINPACLRYRTAGRPPADGIPIATAA